MAEKKFKNSKNENNSIFSFFLNMLFPHDFLFLGLAFKILEYILSKKIKLIVQLEEMKKIQLEEIQLYKERFLRDMENKKRNLENYAMSLINIKILESKTNKEKIKEFYIQLESDYKELLNNIKIKFNI